MLLLVYLEFEHGTQFFLPDLQRADLSGQSHERGVETLFFSLKTPETLKHKGRINTSCVTRHYFWQ